MSKVPTKQQLDELILLLESITQKGIDAAGGKWTTERPCSFLDVYRFLSNQYQGEINAWDEACNTAAGEWLTSSAAAKRAWRSLNHSSVKVPHAPPRQWLRRHTARLIASAIGTRKGSESDDEFIERIEEIATGQLDDRFKVNLAFEIEQYFARQSRPIILPIAREFHQYFFGDQVVVRSKTPNELLRELAELEVAVRVLGDKQRWKSLGVAKMPAPAFARIVLRKIGDIRGQLEKVKSAPLARKDVGAKERALAFGLWRVFRKRYRGNKSAALANFLALDGVVNPPASVNTVDRWVKKWSETGAEQYPH